MRQRLLALSQTPALILLLGRRTIRAVRDHTILDFCLKYSPIERVRIRLTGDDLQLCAKDGRQAMNHYDGLADAVVVLTGASGGLGAATAKRFAEHGARLLLSDLNETLLDRLATELDSGPGRMSSIVADLADPIACERLVAEAIDRYGRIDVLINNAAFLGRTPLEEITPELFDQVMAINLRAPLILSRAALALMRAQGRGRIVNVASMAARTGGTSDVFLYAASKAGLLALTRSLARTAADSNVRVNAILPSNIESPMFRDSFPQEVINRVLAQIPLGRTAQPAEVAELILWLASDASSYVTGVSWDINGGWYMT